MKPERWQQLDQMFHAALGREPAERAAFLDEACAGDESLRKQVEELLTAHREAGSFIESPAFEVEARSVAADHVESAVGQIIGQYKIISLLGVGGMGEVYLAEDMTLTRKVALKLLPADFTRNPDRVRRFQQEARTASALNHPNIVTIHGIGQIDNRHFIATEFIDGQTLRQHIRGTQSQVADDGRRTSGRHLKPGELLSLAIQTADALSAAHEAGIVHRDIKPENIMVRRRDSYVKVLDFGLAKLTEGLDVTVDLEGPTRTQVKTSAGVVMGTPSYMSPEQARGEKVDVRTDIWSLGVVLYEMVAGFAPFERPTASEIIASILEREPPPLARYSREVPAELERIISKTLIKDREERYQTAKDLLNDLRRLRQHLEVQAEVERLSTPGSGSEVVIPGDIQATLATTDQATRGTQAEIERRTSSAEYLVSEIKLHKRGAVVALAISLVLLGGIGLGLYRFVIPSRPRPALFQALKFTRLATTGNGFLPSISPDGKYVAYVVEAAGKQGLWINQLATTSNVQIIPSADVHYGRPNFSHDGNYVYYELYGRDDQTGALYRVPALGGAPQKLLVNIQSAISLSPDDKRFAFYRSNQEKREWLLMVANADGSGEQKLASRNGEEWFDYSGVMSGPAWSPDGKVIASGAGKNGLGRLRATVIVVQVADGTQQEFTSQRWLGIGNLAWLRDGSALILGAPSTQNEQVQIWRLTYPGGEVRQLTDDFRRNTLSSMTADDTTMVGAQADLLSNIWVAPGGDASLARQIISSEQGGIGVDSSWLSWTPDGKIVYTSNASGNFDIWLMNADGSNNKQLTFDPSFDASPVMTPDRRYIVFTSNRAGKSSDLDLWRMDADGSNPKLLTNGIEDLGPQCSPDSKWVVYGHLVSGKTVLLKLSIEGGDPVQLTDEESGSPVVSPDGRWIAALYWNGQSDSPQHIAIIPFEGGKPIKLFSSPKTGYGGQHLHWTTDGRAIMYMDARGGDGNIWSQPIDGGPARRLTDFKEQLILSYDWSHDGSQLVCMRGTLVRTIGLWTDSR